MNNEIMYDDEFFEMSEEPVLLRFVLHSINHVTLTYDLQESTANNIKYYLKQLRIDQCLVVKASYSIKGKVSYELLTAEDIPTSNGDEFNVYWHIVEMDKRVNNSIELWKEIPVATKVEYKIHVNNGKGNQIHPYYRFKIAKKRYKLIHHKTYNIKFVVKNLKIMVFLLANAFHDELAKSVYYAATTDANNNCNNIYFRRFRSYTNV